MTYMEIMDTTFNWCVWLLVELAKPLGMTYNEINIWIFVIIEPIVFLMMLFYIIYLKRRISKRSKSHFQRT